MMVGAVDYKVKVDFNDFNIFIARSDDHWEVLFMQFLQGGGEVYLWGLIPLCWESIYGDLVERGRLYAGCFVRLHLRYKGKLLVKLGVKNIFDNESDSEVFLCEVEGTSMVEKMITFAKSSSNSC